LSDSARDIRVPQIRLSNFDLSLQRGTAGRMEPVVQGLRVQITAAGLQALAEGLVDALGRRVPVGFTIKDIRVGPDGVGIVLRVERGIVRGDLATRLVLSAPGEDLLRVELADVDVPVWVPLDVLLDEAVKRSGGAVRRDPANRRALLLDPAALLAQFGVPGRFAAGRWDVATSDAGIDLSFSGDASAA
jgi:hypothetical protein